MPPSGWLRYGLIIPLSVWAIVRGYTRRYFILRFPSWSHEAREELHNDAIVARWRQLALVYTSMEDGTKLALHDGWRWLWLDTDDEPTQITTALEQLERR